MTSRCEIPGSFPYFARGGALVCGELGRRGWVSAGHCSNKGLLAGCLAFSSSVIAGLVSPTSYHRRPSFVVLVIEHRALSI